MCLVHLSMQVKLPGSCGRCARAPVGAPSAASRHIQVSRASWSSSGKSCRTARPGRDWTGCRRSAPVECWTAAWPAPSHAGSLTTCMHGHRHSAGDGKSSVKSSLKVTRFHFAKTGSTEIKHVWVDPPGITALTLPAGCCAGAPAADIDRKAAAIDGTDRQWDGHSTVT